MRTVGLGRGRETVGLGRSRGKGEIEEKRREREREREEVGRGKERKGKERKGKERKGKARSRGRGAQVSERPLGARFWLSVRLSIFLDHLYIWPYTSISFLTGSR